MSKTSREELPPDGRTNGTTGECLLENDALLCQSAQVRRLYDRVAAGAEGIMAELVSEDKRDVRSTHGLQWQVFSLGLGERREDCFPTSAGTLQGALVFIRIGR